MNYSIIFRKSVVVGIVAVGWLKRILRKTRTEKAVINLKSGSWYSSVI